MTEEPRDAEIDRLHATIAKLETAHDQNMREIDRLNADLAAERERRSHYQRIAAELTDKLNGTPCAEIRWHQERDALRAELASAQDEIDAYKMDGSSAAMEVSELRGRLQGARDERDKLRAELAAANVRLDDAMRNKDIITDWYDKAEAERDTLRELLREAGESLMLGYTENTRALARRIDALLGGKDEG